MKRKSNKTVLKGMRWVYVIYAVFALIFCALVLFVPSISEAFEKAMSNSSISIGNISVKTYLTVSFAVGALVDLLYFYLISRCVNGNSKGTFLLVLLVLGVVSGVINVITTKSFSNVGLVIDAVTLFYLILYRKENN